MLVGGSIFLEDYFGFFARIDLKGRSETNMLNVMGELTMYVMEGYK